MVNLQNLISSLTSSQKEELIQLLLTDEMNSTTDKVIYCPKCGSFHLIKNGKSKGHQYFICKDCGKSFVEYKNTIFSSTKKDILLWKSYIRLMFNGCSIKKIAEKLNICIQTSFRWRHKILSILEQKFMNDSLKGIIEVDETFLLESHKGIKYEDDKKIKRKRGISSQQVGILVAVDRNHNVISQKYGNGKISTQNVVDILKNRIEEKSVLVTDGCSAYNEFASGNGFELIKLVKIRKNGIYHINNCNCYQSHLKNFLRHFKGISTKYLDRYLAWYKFINQKNDVNYLFNELILG